MKREVPGCSGKMRHTRQSAEDSAQSIRRGKNFRPGGDFGAYKCGACGWWHVGTDRRNQKHRPRSGRHSTKGSQ